MVCQVGKLIGKDSFRSPKNTHTGILFSKIYRILEPAVRDTSWSPVRRAAFEFLTDFAQVHLYFYLSSEFGMSLALT